MPFEEEAELRRARSHLSQLRERLLAVELEIAGCADLERQHQALAVAITAAECVVEQARSALQEMRLDQNETRRSQAGLRALARVVTISGMSAVNANAGPALHLPQGDRQAALAAIARGSRKFKHIGIRPWGMKNPTLGVVVFNKCLDEADQNAQLSVAVGIAQVAWPGHLEYEVIGSNDFRARTAGDVAFPSSASGVMFDAEVLGRFDVAEKTASEPGT